jgi:cytochrome c553
MLGSVVAITVLLVLAAAAPAAAADVDEGRRKAERCGACHGADGNATAPGIPSLAGMPAFYTHWQLIMYRDGRRRDPQMTPFVQDLTDTDLGDLAAYYATQRPRSRPPAADPSRVAAGRPLAANYHCISCHGPALRGQQQVPQLAGQDFDYLLKRLRGYKAKTTSDLDGMMTMVAQSLSDEDIENLVHFMVSVGVGE